MQNQDMTSKHAIKVPKRQVLIAPKKKIKDALKMIFKFRKNLYIFGKNMDLKSVRAFSLSSSKNL